MKKLYNNVKSKYFLIIVVQIILAASLSHSQSGWIQQSTGMRNNVSINFINPNIGYIIGSDGTILTTNNSGLNWYIISSNNFGYPLLRGIVHSDNMYMVIVEYNVNYGMVFTTTNSGQNWISGANEILPIGTGIVGIRGLDLLNSSTGYVCGFDFGMLNRKSYLDGIVYKTTNSGVNWFQSHRGAEDYNDVKFKDTIIGYVIRHSIVKTENGGSSWHFTAGLTSNNYAISNIFNDTLYVTSSLGRVHRSINGGFNWTQFYTPSNDTLKKIYFVNSKTGYAVGNAGFIIKTTNAGENWTLQNSGTTEDLNSIWFINKDTGFVVGDSGVVLKTYTGGLTDISHTGNEIPTEYFLSQNYPNPFNPKTKINYTLGIGALPDRKAGIAAYVILKVYNSLGKEVASLVNQKQLSGSYSVTFDGSNLPSGIYFYKLFIDENTIDTKRMVLLK